MVLWAIQVHYCGYCNPKQSQFRVWTSSSVAAMPRADLWQAWYTDALMILLTILMDVDGIWRLFHDIMKVFVGYVDGISWICDKLCVLMVQDKPATESVDLLVVPQTWTLKQIEVVGTCDRSGRCHNHLGVPWATQLSSDTKQWESVGTSSPPIAGQSSLGFRSWVIWCVVKTLTEKPVKWLLGQFKRSEPIKPSCSHPSWIVALFSPWNMWPWGKVVSSP